MRARRGSLQGPGGDCVSGQLRKLPGTGAGEAVERPSLRHPSLQGGGEAREPPSNGELWLPRRGALEAGRKSHHQAGWGAGGTKAHGGERRSRVYQEPGRGSRETERVHRAGHGLPSRVGPRRHPHLPPACFGARASLVFTAEGLFTRAPVSPTSHGGRLTCDTAPSPRAPVS